MKTADPANNFELNVAFSG